MPRLRHHPPGGAPANTSSVSISPASTHAGAVSDLFEKGSRYWSVTAGASDDETLGYIYFTQIRVNHYLVENLALEYGGIFGYADAKRTPAGMLSGPEIGVRWHFAKHQRWSTYLEGLVGAVFQQHPLTPDSLRFNFDLQPGAGATYRLSPATILLGGFSWHHLSNAQIRGRAHNFGYDGPTLYLELMKAF